MTGSNLPSTTSDSIPIPLGKLFLRLGWISFWMQFALGIIPVLLLIFATLFRGATTDGPGTTTEVSLAYTSMIFLVFSLVWSFRYTRLGRAFFKPERRPTPTRLNRVLRVGLIGNLLGMICTMLVAMGAVGGMLFAALSLPQGAIPTLGSPQMSAVGRHWIVPLDVVWLQALLNNMAAQLVGLIVSLFLLNRITKHRQE